MISPLDAFIALLAASLIQTSLPKSLTAVEEVARPMVLALVVMFLNHLRPVLARAHSVQLRTEDGEAQLSMKSHMADARIVPVIKSRAQVASAERVDRSVSLQLVPIHLQFNRHPAHGGDFGADAIFTSVGNVRDRRRRRALEL